MRVFYDTEFLERGPQYPIELISLGMVADDGRELYVINGEAELSAIAQHAWLMENVVPSLPLYVPEDPEVREFVGGLMWDDDHPDYDAYVFNRRVIRAKVSEFFDQTSRPELWGYCASYDHVLLAQIFGTMDKMHHKLRYYTNDIAQVVNSRDLGIDVGDFPENKGTQHNALDDARWTRDVYNFIHGSD